MALSPFSIGAIPQEIIYKFLGYEDQIDFVTISESGQKIWEIIQLQGTCKHFYKIIHECAFFSLFSQHIHPYFLPSKEISWNEALKESFQTLKAWRESKPQIFRRQIYSGINQYALCEKGQLVIYDIATASSYYCYYLESEEIKTISIGKDFELPFLDCYPAYASSDQFIVFLSGRNTLFVYSPTKQSLLKSLILEEESILQIELKEEKLYLVVCDENEERYLRSYTLTSISQAEHKLEMCILVPSSTKKFYLCGEDILFFIEEENAFSILAYCQKTLKWRSTEKGEDLKATLNSKIDEENIVVGDHSLFSVIKNNLTIQIDSLQIQQGAFANSQSKFILKETHQQASILMIQYYLEKMFIYLTNHYCVICDLSKGKWANHMQAIYMLPNDSSSKWKPSSYSTFYPPHMVATSFKMHCLLASERNVTKSDSSSEDEDGLSNETTYIFTLDFPNIIKNKEMLYEQKKSINY